MRPPWFPSVGALILLCVTSNAALGEGVGDSVVVRRDPVSETSHRLWLPGERLGAMTFSRTGCGCLSRRLAGSPDATRGHSELAIAFFTERIQEAPRMPKPTRPAENAKPAARQFDAAI